MTPEEQEWFRHVEQDERWLHEHAGPGPRLGSHDPLNLRVRLAAGEAWLSQFPSPQAGVECICRVKQAVRDELTTARLRVGPALLAGHRFVRAVVPWAAAAVVAFGVLIGLCPHGESVPAPDTLGDFVYAAEQVRGQEDWGFGDLKDQIAALESMLAGSRRPGVSEYPLDEIEGNLRDLWEELDSARAGSTPDSPA